jgi:predicted nucleic acid-binding Zn ribbon protein
MYFMNDLILHCYYCETILNIDEDTFCSVEKNYKEIIREKYNWVVEDDCWFCSNRCKLIYLISKIDKQIENTMKEVIKLDKKVFALEKEMEKLNTELFLLETAKDLEEGVYDEN